MRNCQRCGGEVSWTSDKIRLFGGVSAHLCVNCETEFDRLFKDHPLFTELNRLTAREAHYASLAYAQRPVSEDAWAELTIGRTRVERQFHDIGAEFVKPLVGAEAASADD
jgi:hypothetical protein